jgi:hypothetical protein
MSVVIICMQYVCLCADPIGRAVQGVGLRPLGLRVRTPQRARLSVSCEYCVLSGRCLCVGLITLPEESYRLWCV